MLATGPVGPRPACRAAVFLLYVLAALGSTLYLILMVSPEVQASNILVYVAICSIVGSLSGARSRQAGLGGRRGAVVDVVQGCTVRAAPRGNGFKLPSSRGPLLTTALSHPPPAPCWPHGTVMSCKALGIALKLTFEGRNQFVYPQTFFFILVVASAVITQVGGKGAGRGA